jgi:hypothetical protein
LIPNDALANALRDLGFEFKRQADRVMIWKKRGTTCRVSVRRNSSHDIEYSRTVLKLAGMPEAEIEIFVANYRRVH